jgi:hypothetical protein
VAPWAILGKTYVRFLWRRIDPATINTSPALGDFYTRGGAWAPQPPGRRLAC